ncbi:hypothetical protein [Marinomonas shanghaiensis]|uniref:hypothetical protein n=1 Tax=Marinomonas shanghaiensis TaxID=2202418 RepID=UPI0013001A8D|nr:hypothetical protein [Marinomonas shanghaiensis]
MQTLQRKTKKRTSKVTAESIKKAAATGNAGMEYFLKHGKFPTSKEQLNIKPL